MIVTTQAELDKALADGADRIEIRSAPDVELEVSDSATVRAFDSATVHAFDFATVRAHNSATVRAFDSATVWASGSATVRASDSATVWASDSATVRALESATVTAHDFATVHAFGFATVRAGSRVAIHQHSVHATITGGVIIDHTAEPTDPAGWCAWHDVTVADGIATLYKAVNAAWTTDRGVDYSPGSTPEADDWRPDGVCGGGLHFSPTPTQAAYYHPAATRYIAVGVRVDELSPILGSTPKAKARRVVVPCREVTIDTEPVG